MPKKTEETLVKVPVKQPSAKKTVTKKVPVKKTVAKKAPVKKQGASEAPVKSTREEVVDPQTLLLEKLDKTTAEVIRNNPPDVKITDAIAARVNLLNNVQ